MIPEGLRPVISGLRKHGPAEAAVRAQALYEVVIEERVRIAKEELVSAQQQYRLANTILLLDVASARLRVAERALDDARRIYQAVFHNPVPYPKYAGD